MTANNFTMSKPELFTKLFFFSQKNATSKKNLAQLAESPIFF